MKWKPTRPAKGTKVRYESKVKYFITKELLKGIRLHKDGDCGDDVIHEMNPGAAASCVSTEPEEVSNTVLLILSITPLASRANSLCGVMAMTPILHHSVSKSDVFYAAHAMSRQISADAVRNVCWLADELRSQPVACSSSSHGSSCAPFLPDNISNRSAVIKEKKNAGDDGSLVS